MAKQSLGMCPNANFIHPGSTRVRKYAISLIQQRSGPLLPKFKVEYLVFKDAIYSHAAIVF